MTNKPPPSLVLVIWAFVGHWALDIHLSPNIFLPQFRRILRPKQRFLDDPWGYIIRG
jgi:hypothetical protein